MDSRGLVVMRRILLCAALAGLATAGEAAAATQRGLFFEDAAKVEAGWAELTKPGVRVVVCNAGPRTVKGLRARLVGFALERGRKPVATKRILKPAGLAKSLRGGSCRAVTLKALEATPPDPKAYEGELLVVSAGAGALRRPVTVVGTGYKAPAKIKSVRETTPFTATGGPFWMDAELDDNKLALVADFTSHSIKRLSKGRKIGQVFKDGDSADVTVDGDPKKADNDQVVVPIRVEGMGHPGVYSGKLDLTGTTDEKEQIAITVEATDDLWWALIAIGAGVFIGLVPILVRRGNVLSDIERVRDGLGRAYEQAFERFRDSSNVGRRFCAPNPSALIDELNPSIERYKHGTIDIKRTDKEYQRLRATLRAAERDTQTIGDTAAGLGPALDGLEVGLEELEEFLAGDKWADEPEFRGAAWGLLSGGQLPVGGSAELKEKALAYSALTDDWLAAAKILSPLEARAAALVEGAGEMTAPDQERLAQARSLAAEAGDRLRAVSAPGEIDPAIHTAIHTVDGSLTYLLDRYVQLSATGAPQFTEPQLGAMGIFLSAREESTPDRSRADLIAQGLPQLAHIAIAWMHRGVRTVLDIGVVGLAFATAIVTSLTAFYFGEPWGTTEDYLTVILIGTAAQTVLKAVTDSLEQRAADRDDTEAEPEPAA